MNTKSKYNSADYINKWYNDLYVLEYLSSNDDRNGFDSQAYICKCRCGATTIKRVKHVINGTAKRCDYCNRLIKTKSKYDNSELIGKEFGALTIKEFISTADTRNTENAPAYMCACQCGNIVIKKASHVLGGNTRSCGMCHETRSKYANKKFVGMQFGKLTITGIGYSNNQNTFICNCNCNRSDAVEYSASMVYNGYRTQCDICAKESSIAALNTKKYSEEYKRSLINKQFGKLMIRSIYKNDKGHTIAKCDCRCGNTGHEVLLCNILRDDGTRACGKCRVAPNHKYDDESYIGKTFNFLEVISIQKKDKMVFWFCKCNLCGNTKLIPAHAVVYGNNKSCGCMQSYGETVIEQALIKHNIRYKKQVTFPNLLGIRGGRLRFDFGIYNENDKLLGLIEYDGDQHFNDYNKNYYITEFELINGINITKENDKIKNEYCKKNNIQLVRLNGQISETIFFEKMRIACNNYRNTN